jgi:hypothetical protein
MVEQLFYSRYWVLPRNHPKIPCESMKQLVAFWRLTRMIPTIRPIAISAARSLLMVVIALLIVMVLLPAALAVQAASG